MNREAAHAPRSAIAVRKLSLSQARSASRMLPAARLDRLQHGGGRAPVASLPLGQFELDRSALGIDKRVDSAGHATSFSVSVGSPAPFAHGPGYPTLVRRGSIPFSR